MRAIRALPAEELKRCFSAPHISDIISIRMYIHVHLCARGHSCGLTRAPCHTVKNWAVANGFHATHMHASASVHVNMCHELSHAHDAHAKHVQVLSAERLLSESLPGALNGRADDGLGRRRQLAGGSCGPDD